MHKRLLLPVAFVAIAFPISGAAFLGLTVANAQGTGCHTATQAEVDAGALPGRQVCAADAAAGITNDAGQAKDYLKSLPRTGSATDNSNVDKLNSAFTICAANFLKEYQKKYGGITMTSAYRSPAYDAQMCRNNPACGNLMNNPNPMGNHQRGLAMDIRAQGDQMTIINFARQNPQFGVCFPFTGEGGGFRDTVHIILVGGPGSEANGPGCRGVTKACEAGHFDPSSIKDASPTSASPSSSLSDAIRQALGQQQQQPQPSAQPAQPAPPAQPAASSQSNTPQSTDSSATSQTTPVSEILNTNTNTNTNTNANSSTTKATSSIDLIEDFLDDPTSDSIDIGTAVDIDLNPDTGDAASLDGGRPTSTSATGTLAVYQGLSAPQTFTSGDLANSPGSGFAGSDNTFTSRLLDTMKRALLLALGYLRPFGGYESQSTFVY